MMNGTTLVMFTAFHVALSLVGIAAGAMVIQAQLKGRQSAFWTNLFLWTTGVTCITGFLFTFRGITPGIVVGILCLLTIVVALYARHSGRIKTFTFAVCLAEAFNLIVLVSQLFAKVALLHHLAPAGTEPIVAVCQSLVLLLLLVLAWSASRKIERP